jgi:hypothetical protein
MAHEVTHLRTVVSEDGAAILDLRHGTISTLNVTGAYVWQELEKGEAPEGIITGLAEKTGEAREVIERDVRNFLSTLEEQKLFLR